jgi:hypothetical protein
MIDDESPPSPSASLPTYPPAAAALAQANAGQVFKAGKEKEAKAAGSSKKKKKVVPG